MKLTSDIATHPPVLNEREWELVAELLERELAELPAEVRRTRSSTLHDELSERLSMVRSLLHRIEES
ncbi:MAG: hypothetical protein JNL98_30420 [Bryobacterales bacterium]|nr:hypothetical protein [Bryobacterales bacterium]